jgi:endonuclease-3
VPLLHGLMVKAKSPFKNIVQQLEAHYGRPKPPKLCDPLHLILFESIGYLVDDDRREAAFAALRKQVGLNPAAIVATPIQQLIAIARLGGIHSDVRARRLKEIGLIVLTEFDGDLSGALKLPKPQAIRALKMFPSIAEPGAEKILLFTKTYPVLALESNGLRVLLRLGFGEEHKNYSTSYASVREALRDQIGDDCDFLIRAHQLLRQHGKQLCRTNNPACDVCPLQQSCPYYESRARSFGKKR